MTNLSLLAYGAGANRQRYSCKNLFLEAA